MLASLIIVFTYLALSGLVMRKILCLLQKSLSKKRLTQKNRVKTRPTSCKRLLTISAKLTNRPRKLTKKKINNKPRLMDDCGAGYGAAFLAIL